MTTQDPRRGIWMMVATALIFALQDALSRHLAGTYNVLMVVMIRYWFFAAFVMVLAARAPGGLRAAIRSRHTGVQIFRGLLLAAEILVMVQGFVLLGLVQAHAIFAAYPLIIAALSGPLLGERVGWRRWAAIGVGFLGIMVILRPGTGVFTPLALIPLASAFMFALYGLLTRYVSRRDAASVSFFWTGVAGAVFTTATGLWFWEPMRGPDIALLALLCCTALLAHWLMIKAYELAEASVLQPFALLQLPAASLLGILIFSDDLRWNVGIGAAIVVAASLFTLWRARVRAAR